MATNPEDAWEHRPALMRCRNCMYFVAKGDEESRVGRCRRHAPALAGWRVVVADRDWCGDHKLVELVVAQDEDDGVKVRIDDLPPPG